MNKEKLIKQYKWLGDNPIIEDHDSHWRVYKQKHSSPLILSKNYG